MNYQILQTLLVLIFLLQTAGSDPGGGGRLRGSGLNQTNSMSVFLPLSTYTLKILGLGGGGVWGSRPPDLCWIHPCTVCILSITK
jgi:hypothetical protein